MYTTNEQLHRHLDLGSSLMVSKSYTFLMNFSNQVLCLVLEKFGLDLFVVFDGMFLINIKNKLA